MLKKWRSQMKINSTREVTTILSKITNESDFPKTMDIQTTNGWVTLEKIGSGMADGQKNIVYMSKDTENVRIEYIIEGDGIKVTDASYKDANTVNVANVIPAKG